MTEPYWNVFLETKLAYYLSFVNSRPKTVYDLSPAKSQNDCSDNFGFFKRRTYALFYESTCARFLIAVKNEALLWCDRQY